jgi:hypothetical protein
MWLGNRFLIRDIFNHFAGIQIIILSNIRRLCKVLSD